MRSATALEIAAALPSLEAAKRADGIAGLSKCGRPRAFASLAGTAVVVALLVAAAAFIWTRAGRAALTPRDTIILADFLNTTGDPVFDSTLKVALAVTLEQSPFLKVFPDDRVHEALLLMQRSPTEGITRAIARQIAEREQLKALVAGSIGSLGRHYDALHAYALAIDEGRINDQRPESIHT